MNIFPCINKVLHYAKHDILNMSYSDFQQKFEKYNFEYEDLLIVIGIILNKKVIDSTKAELSLMRKNLKEEIIVDFAVFTYLFIGDEFNDQLALARIKIHLKKNLRHLFLTTLTILITKYTRTFILLEALGNDNYRSNMFAVNAMLEIKRGIGLDNFHIILFMVYQSLELKLKQCLKKYIAFEPTAYKKQINFHNLVRLVKLISTSKVSNNELLQILTALRKNLRYFEKINPGGQVARYEVDRSKNFFSYTTEVVNEKEFWNNYIDALNLLQKLYLKLIEIYDSNNDKTTKIIIEKLSPNLAKTIGIDFKDSANKINEKLKNLLDQQIFGNKEELEELTYQDLIILRFLIRVGYVHYLNQAVTELLQK